MDYVILILWLFGVILVGAILAVPLILYANAMLMTPKPRINSSLPRIPKMPQPMKNKTQQGLRYGVTDDENRLF